MATTMKPAAMTEKSEPDTTLADAAHAVAIAMTSRVETDRLIDECEKRLVALRKEANEHAIAYDRAVANLRNEIM